MREKVKGINRSQSFNKKKEECIKKKEIILKWMKVGINENKNKRK